MHPVRVLVYCMSGRSRAPSVAVAYVMFKLRMRLEDAKTFVASKYPRGHRGIMWKEGDLDALKEFERELAENPPDRLPSERASAPPRRRVRHLEMAVETCFVRACTLFVCQYFTCAPRCIYFLPPKSLPKKPSIGGFSESSSLRMSSNSPFCH